MALQHLGLRDVTVRTEGRWGDPSNQFEHFYADKNCFLRLEHNDEADAAYAQTLLKQHGTGPFRIVMVRQSASDRHPQDVTFYSPNLRGDVELSGHWLTNKLRNNRE